MRKFILSLLTIFCMGLVLVTATSCTENQRAKHWGGTENITLPDNVKLINATWKDADLWILTKQAKETDVSEDYTFSEKSTWGVLQGTINIRESITSSKNNGTGRSPNSPATNK